MTCLSEERPVVETRCDQQAVLPYYDDYWQRRRADPVVGVDEGAEEVYITSASLFIAYLH